MKKLPTSVENFEKLIKGDYYYIDKSMLIKDIVTLSGEIKLITRPRRFGKTLNMDMMLHFFSLDEEEDLFERLKIWNEKEIVKEHYHKYPVIYISFKSIKKNSWEKALDGMKDMINDIATEVRKYTNSKEDDEYLERLIKKEGTEAEYSDFLRYVSKMIYKKVGTPPVILIDEYDVPIESAYLNRHKDPEYYDNMIDFMRAFLTAALKGSDTYFSFAVLTGVYRIAKESIFSGLNNLAVFTVFDEQLDDKYGFTEDEVREIISYYNLTDEDKEIIDIWYGGYIIGEEHNLYNPWSVINYISNRLSSKRPPYAHAKKYWVNTSENSIIKEQVKNSKEVHQDILNLIAGKEINKTLDTSISLVELERSEKGVWVLFASSGYLSPRYNYESKEAENFYLKIPNEEIMRFFKESVVEWIKEKTGVDGSTALDKINEMIKEGKYEGFAVWLKEFLTNGLSYYDVAKDEAERFYKGFLLGILSVAINGYVGESEIESGYGRLDVAVYPKDKSYGRYAAIFEVKRENDESKLEEKAKEALLQIKDRKYYSKMESLGYKVIGFGIAFCGKNVAVKVEVL